MSIPELSGNFCGLKTKKSAAEKIFCEILSGRESLIAGKDYRSSKKPGVTAAVAKIKGAFKQLGFTLTSSGEDQYVIDRKPLEELHQILGIKLTPVGALFGQSSLQALSTALWAKLQQKKNWRFEAARTELPQPDLSKGREEAGKILKRLNKQKDVASGWDLRGLLESADDDKSGFVKNVINGYRILGLLSTDKPQEDELIAANYRFQLLAQVSSNHKLAGKLGPSTFNALKTALGKAARGENWVQ